MKPRLKHICALAESIGNLEGMLTDRHRDTCVIPERLHYLFDRAIANMKAAQDFIQKTPDAATTSTTPSNGIIVTNQP
jgi:hypothetical protein